MTVARVLVTLAASAIVAVLAVQALAASPAANTVVQADRTWVCNGPVDLDSVTVTMTAKASGKGQERDAIHLQPGCTGRIGKLDVTTSIADGVKVAAGVHDLEVGGGTIRCLAKLPILHQDGIQVMGGDRITFSNMTIDCGRLDADLINSNLFINMAGRATTPPTDVVCDACSFGGGAAHTVLIQQSIRSGITNSTLCRGKFPGLTLTIGSVAVDPVDVDNKLIDCGTGGSTGSGTTKLTLHARASSLTLGKSVVLVGAFEKLKQGRRVTMYARPYGSTAFLPVTTLTTDAKGAWQVVVRPRISTTYRAVSKSSTSPTILVGVRPRVELSRARQRLVVQVSAKYSFGGRRVVLQRENGGHWVFVAAQALRAGGRATFSTNLHGARVRAVVGVAPGYLESISAPVTVP